MTGLLEAVGGVLAELLGQPLVGLSIRFAAGCLVILWLLAAWWIWQDARARAGEAVLPYAAAGAVIACTPFLLPFVVAAWLVLRPPQTIAEARAARLQRTALTAETETLLCRGCDRRVDADWLRCPDCGTRLATRCDDCGRPVGLDWQICAWCAAEIPQQTASRTTDRRRDDGGAASTSAGARPASCRSARARRPSARST
jgi:hypothetical protein